MGGATQLPISHTKQSQVSINSQQFALYHANFAAYIMCVYAISLVNFLDLFEPPIAVYSTWYLYGQLASNESALQNMQKSFLPGCSKPHSCGWARVLLSSFLFKFLSILNFLQIVLIFWPWLHHCIMQKSQSENRSHKTCWTRLNRFIL